MSTREALEELLGRLPEPRLVQIMEFAQFLAWQEERAGWQRFGQDQLARAYGDDEPEYTEADLKPGGPS